jgi:hypothetical protein
MATKLQKVRLHLAELRYPYKTASCGECGHPQRKWAKKGPYVVAGVSPKEAAQLFLDHLRETDANIRGNNLHDGRIYIGEYVWDGKPGFKVAADHNGDKRFDVEWHRGKCVAVYSEKSFA